METILKSPTKIVAIGSDHPLVIIGERINPTGRKKLAQALEERNLKLVQEEATKQVEEGAQILDINMDRLRYLDDIMPPNVNVLYSDRHTIREQLKRADLVIGSVLIPGAKAPRLISREDLKLMNPGSVIIDVAIDQGGCVETSRPTTHSDPTYIEEEVVHYCVTNMPGAVGRTSTFALCNVTLPWALQIAGRGIEAATRELPPIAAAVNIRQGQITNAENRGRHAHSGHRESPRPP